MSEHLQMQNLAKKAPTFCCQDQDFHKIKIKPKARQLFRQLCRQL